MLYEIDSTCEIEPETWKERETKASEAAKKKKKKKTKRCRKKRNNNLEDATKEKKDTTTTATDTDLSNSKVENTIDGKIKIKNNTSDARVLYLFYQTCADEKYAIRVYAINATDLSMYPVTKLPRNDTYFMGCIAYGSKLYVIGGEYPFGPFPDCIKRWGYPRDVWICDLGQLGTSAPPYKWEKGPELKGGKPNPLIVGVRNKLYALAGHSVWLDNDPEIINPIFEVLDLEPGKGAQNDWRELPNPPFYSSYLEPLDLKLLGHTVIGDTVIFVRVQITGESVVKDLYSFDVTTEKWESHEQGVKSNSCNGLANVLKKFRWYGGADVVNNKLYACDAGMDQCVKVYAYNLVPKLKEKWGMSAAVDKAASPTSEDADIDARGLRNGASLPCVSDSDECYYIHDDGYNVFPPTMVQCIKLPMKSMIRGDPLSHALVTHLGDGVFLVACFYFASYSRLSCDRRYVYSCKFKVVKQDILIPDAEGSPKPLDCAVIMNHKFCSLSCSLVKPSVWSTM